MSDAVRGYVQLASGLTQVTRQRALEAARQLLAAMPASEVTTAASVGAQALSGQVSALADELLATGRQNRAQLRELVRAEIEAVLSRWGLSADAELEAALAVSRARVVELESRLARLEDERATASAAKKAAAKKTAAKKSAAKKNAAKKSAAKKSAAKKSAAPSSTAQQSSTAQPSSTAQQSAAQQAGPTPTEAPAAPSTPAGES